MLSVEPDMISELIILCFIILGIFLLLALLYKRETIYIVVKTFPRDIRGIVRFVKTFKGLKNAEKKNLNVGTVFDATAKSHPDKICFYFEDEKWTFKMIEEQSNQIGNYFQRQGFKKGDNIALFMENCPEYVAIWLGLAKIGVVVPLINYNLKHQTLQHSLTVASAKAIIFGQELASSLYEVIDLGIPEMLLYCFGQPTAKNSINLEAALTEESTVCPIPSETINFTDSLFYIYTSGTTGLPKPAIIKHSRFLMGSISFHCMSDLFKTDILYTSLPLYHTAAGICTVGQAFFYGNSVVLRKKFSASHFWKDCIKHNVTISQYIGEMGRYLLAQPSCPEETQHKVRMVIGNGLSSTIWNQFVNRFKIQSITEIYGSTDGNVNMANCDGTVGAVGFLPILLQKIYPMSLIRVDKQGEPVRDVKTGLAIKCNPNEQGELVGKIIKNHIIRDFQGYADSDSNTKEKKVIYDVFTKGDMAFRSGDLLILDKYGYFYFKDRTGDTFRWKGENVSTCEVESVISNDCGYKDAVVYSVKVPQTEGSCGMVCIADPDKQLDLDSFASGILTALPSYARPLFLRIKKQIDITGTFKLKKTQLQQEGFDVTKVKDPIYFYNGGKYVTLDNDLYMQLTSGQIKI